MPIIVTGIIVDLYADLISLFYSCCRKWYESCYILAGVLWPAAIEARIGVNGEYYESKKNKK